MRNFDHLWRVLILLPSACAVAEEVGARDDIPSDEPRSSTTAEAEPSQVTTTPLYVVDPVGQSLFEMKTNRGELLGGSITLDVMEGVDQATLAIWGQRSPHTQGDLDFLTIEIRTSESMWNGGMTVAIDRPFPDRSGASARWQGSDWISTTGTVVLGTVEEGSDTMTGTLSLQLVDINGSDTELRIDGSFEGRRMIICNYKIDDDTWTSDNENTSSFCRSKIAELTSP